MTRSVPTTLAGLLAAFLLAGASAQAQTGGNLGGTASVQGPVKVDLRTVLTSMDRIPGLRRGAFGYAFTALHLEGNFISFHASGAEEGVVRMGLAQGQTEIIAKVGDPIPDRAAVFSTLRGGTVSGAHVVLTGGDGSYTDGVYFGRGPKLKRWVDENDDWSLIRPFDPVSDGVGVMFFTLPDKSGPPGLFYTEEVGRMSALGNPKGTSYAEVLSASMANRVAVAAKWIVIGSHSFGALLEYQLPSTEPIVVVDDLDPMPGWHRNFGVILGAATDGATHAFVGSDGVFPYHDGLYTSRGGLVSLVADEDTLLPGWSVYPEGFWTEISVSQGNVAFVAYQTVPLTIGLFVQWRGQLVKVLDTNDTYAGLDVESVEILDRSFDGDTLVFQATVAGVRHILCATLTSL